ncbi:hypothetical protein R3P38DRAFT_2512889 [Favolaschia claudopus]|uniref:Uncharacterized protein n=1 Tax=Favolaschia claudopus TaxID=2862362 RepID=A0AAW0CR88_9AGAR
MADLPRYPNGRIHRKFATPLDPDNEVSLEWIGINAPCDRIPSGALDFCDRMDYQDEYSAKDEFGRFLTIEWADQPDWYDLSTHNRGWTPLAKEGDTKRGSWARNTKSYLRAEGPDADGKWGLDAAELREVEADTRYFRMLLEELSVNPLMDSETYTPYVFDYEKLHMPYNFEDEVHEMVMEVRRSVLDHMGTIAWWTAVIPQWADGVAANVVQDIQDLDFRSYHKTGYLFKLSRDWRGVNFGLLIRKDVPFFYVWGEREMRDKRFARLDPATIDSWYASNERNELKELWADDIPLDFSEWDLATHYDRFLQLKIDPYCRPRNPLPQAAPDGGSLDETVIDGQGWKRRGLAEDESIEEMHQHYHHVVVERKSTKTTIIIFQRFHPKPKKEEMTRDRDIVMDSRPPPDEEILRERFKSRSAPGYGEIMDPETGVVREQAIQENSPSDDVAKYEHQLTLNAPMQALGTHLIHPLNHSSRYDDSEHDATSYGRSVAPRLTSPDSDHSSERRESKDSRLSYSSSHSTALPPYLGARRAHGGATYSSCLWRIPFDEGWNPVLLEKGYLIISEAAEFRLRYQILANPSLRFPRHVLEVALERGIPILIGYKRSDCDHFRPKKSDLDFSPSVNKALVDLRGRGPRIAMSPSIPTMYMEYRRILGKLADLPQARALILRGGATSWIMRAYVGMGLVARALKGPSVQVTVFHAGGNDTGDDHSLDLTWDEVSEGDLESVYGYIPGPTTEQDLYFYPTDAMLEDFSDHYHREWNPFCEETFKKIKTELDNNRGKARTRGDWKKFFQSSNRGERRPRVVAKEDLIEEEMARLKGALMVESWNKRRIADVGRDLPHHFIADF